MKLQHIFIGATLVLVACSTKIAQQKEAAQNIDMQGQWYIENIVFNDSNYVCPGEEVSGSRQYITFDRDGYFIQTNCNTFSGSYSISGDTLTLGDGAMTEMACDNMATEEAMRKLIMRAANIDTENDSIMRLNFIDTGAYIILRKATEKK
ncbi:MAG: META domain-containing protein [Muribaculaceae bacterium]|nr:META domain-containing protein [Muribaculaceae bacterium]